jgi:CheY-like chemotaxis protein
MAVDILLVDDDAVQGATRKAILDRVGHLAAIATDGLAALDFLRSPEGASVRMVITDHLMPGMNGPDFVRALQQAGFALPVLVLSGYAEAEEEYEALNVTFRLKPYAPDRLIAVVQYLIDAFQRRSA